MFYTFLTLLIFIFSKWCFKIENSLSSLNTNFLYSNVSVIFAKFLAKWPVLILFLFVFKLQFL